ncbi:MAG: hypothetical protein GY877_10625 [Hyphomicrobium sp.]|nr:hypothetical protein [Hyphomicrobium sp.]
MVLDPAQYPDDISALKAMLIAETKARITAETRVNDHPAKKLDDLLPWNWKEAQAIAA